MTLLFQSNKKVEQGLDELYQKEIEDKLLRFQSNKKVEQGLDIGDYNGGLEIREGFNPTKK